MGWARKSVPAKKVEAVPNLVGLDLNATCARAVLGPARVLPRAVPMDGDRDELAMVLSLQGRHAEIGRAGASVRRLLPHLVCQDFLSHLGEQHEWKAGRHRIDAARAVSLAFERVHRVCAEGEGMAVSVPSYLSRAQVMMLCPLAERAGISWLASVPAPLAAALAVYRNDPWSGLVLVVDADDHAFTAAIVAADESQLITHTTQAWSHLHSRAWKGMLLNAVADRCIRQSRRDPRDCASAEQSLYEQIEDSLEKTAQGKTIELLIQTDHWYQNLPFQPEDLNTYCAPLVGRVLEKIRELLKTIGVEQALSGVIVSRAVANLPGLLAALKNRFSEQSPSEPIELSDDFGEDLLRDPGGAARVTVLPRQAFAQAAHEVAVRVQDGDLPRSYFDLALPLATGEPRSSTGAPPKKVFRLLSFDL